MEKFSWKYFKTFSVWETFPRGSKNQIGFRNKIYRVIENIYLCDNPYK